MITIILIIISFVEKSKIKFYHVIKIIMRYLLPSIALTFFGQIFEFLILIYLCDENGIIDEYNSFECPNKTLYYLFSILCSLAILFLLIISFITVSIFYKPTFMKDKNNSITKIDSFSNLVFFYNKILFIVLTNINSSSQIYIWFMLIILFISTFVNMISFTKYNNYINSVLIEINKLFSILLFTFVSNLIIGKIFNGLGFNGTIYLYLFGIFIATLSAFLYKSNLSSFSYIDFKELNSRCEQILYINEFLDLVKVKNLYREKTLTFDSLILIREENCINKNCKLKKYLKTVEKGQPNDFLLFQYCQSLYEIALKKSNDTILKVNYIVYLIVQMSKIKLAEKVLHTIKFRLFHFEENFMLFCCQKFIKSFNNNSEDNFNGDNISLTKRLEYDKLVEEFKKDLIHASSLFYEFWNIINNYHIKGTEDFNKLRNIGKQLTKIINTIDEKFKILQSIKGANLDLLLIYSEFVKYVLSDKTKYENIKNILTSISNVDKIKDFEIDYTNFDLKYFKSNDEYKYMTISAEEENLGTILYLSNGAAKIFGYSKQELIGKKFSLLLPFISQKEFEDYLVKHAENSKIKFYEALIKNKEYFPQIEELFINAKDKSKYLIPVYIKMMFVQTEESYHAFILTLSHLENINLDKLNDIFKLGGIFNPNKHIEENLFKYCIILTDMNFRIQTFTSNCQEHLGLNTHSMSSNIDITQFITEFKDAVYKMEIENIKKLKEKSERNAFGLTDFEGNHRSERRSKTGKEKIIDISPEKKLIYKRYIAQNNYSESKLVTWKSDTLADYLVKNKSAGEGKNINSRVNDNNLIQEVNESIKEKLFLLIIKKAEFNNKQFGYIFLFHREKVNYIEKNSKAIKSSFKNNKNEKLLKAHKATFSTFKSSDNLNDKSDNDENNKNVDDNRKKAIKYSKSQKRITKMPKSLDIEVIQNQNKGNIVGLIESKIKNILNEDSYNKNSPIKKCNFKNLPSNLSLFGNKYSNNELISDLPMDFVPNSDFNFSFDVNITTFRPSYTLITAEEFSEILKAEAQKKVNLIQKDEKPKIEDSSNYSSNEENESNESEENSKIFSGSEKSISKKAIEKKKKEENIKRDVDYYHVNGLNKIKLMIFDFDQEMVIENEGQKDNKSEVEIILTNYKLKLSNSLDKDSNNPSTKINKFLLKYSSKKIIKDKIVQNDSISQIQNTEKIKKQKKLYAQIISKLNKDEQTKSIILYGIICLLFNIMFLGIGAFSLYFIRSKLEEFKGNLSILVYASLLRHYTNLGVYHTRMYILTKINETEGTYKNYNNYDIEKNRTKYTEDLYKKLENDFFLGSQYLEKVISIDFKLNENNKNKLYSKSLNNVLMGSDFSQRNISSSYMVGISQIYSHFYYLIANIEQFDYNSPEVLNFILNVLNNGDIILKEIIEIYINEIELKKNNHVKLSYIILIIYFLLLTLIFIFIYINYTHILNKRDNYISTFYQINLSFIRTSIFKCEKFLNQINQNESTKNFTKKKEETDNTMSVSNFDNNNLLSNDQIDKNAENKIYQIKIRKGKTKKKRNKHLVIIIICFLLAIYLYMLIPLLEFNKYISKFEIMALYMHHMLHYHNNIISVYNAFNEYLFYENSTVENIPVSDFIEKTIGDTFNTLTEDLSYLGTNSSQIPGLYDVFIKVQQEQLCKNYLCDPYIETLTSLGFFSFIAFMTVEIKVKVNYIKILTQANSKYLWYTNQEERRLMLFNNIHNDLDVMFNFVALHYIENEITLTMEKILENINSRNIIYIAIYVVFFIIIIGIYIFFWNPFVTETQSQILNVKEVLKIIPVEILESQTNIKNLLGISDLS